MDISSHVAKSDKGSVLVHQDCGTIKQILLIRHIGRADFYKQSTEYENGDNCSIYEIFQMNNTKCYVNFGQISNIIGEEEWLQGEVNCLCNIASSKIVSLFWGAKKKEYKNSHDFCLCAGDHISVANHGNQWIQCAKICSYKIGYSEVGYNTEKDQD